MNNKPRTVASTMIIVAVIAFAAPKTMADITRGCKGFLRIHLHNIEGEAGSRPVMTSIDEFEGRGQCKSRLSANTCRERAKDAVFRCATELWERRWNLIGNPNDNHADLGLPSSCLGRATGAKGIGLYKKNDFGQVFDIKHEMEFQACCKLQPGAAKLDIRLEAQSTGDKGCGKVKDFPGTWFENRTLIDNYEVNCHDLRIQGLCGGKRTDG